MQAFGKPLEASRYFVQFPAQPCRHAIDQRAADHGLADGRACTPARALAEQVVDGHTQIVVGWQQTGAGGDDAMAVVIGVAGEGDVEIACHAEQTLHRPGRGRVHADRTIPIQTHEGKARVQVLADQVQSQAVSLGNARPVAQSGASERVDADVKICSGDQVQIQNRRKISDIAAKVVVLAGGVRRQRLAQRDPAYAGQLGLQQGIGACFDPAGDVGAGRTAVAGVVLDAAVFGRIVRGRDHQSVGQSLVAPAVVAEDGVRDRRCGRVLAAERDHGLDTIACQHFDHAFEGWLRQRVGIATNEQRTVDALGMAVFAHRLGDRLHVPGIETARERTSAMARSPEGHPLRRHARIGSQIAVGAQQCGNIKRRQLRRALPGQRAQVGRQAGRLRQGERDIKAATPSNQGRRYSRSGRLGRGHVQRGHEGTFSEGMRA